MPNRWKFLESSSLPSSIEEKTEKMRQTSTCGMRPHIPGRPCQPEKHGPLLLVLPEWLQNLSFSRFSRPDNNLRRRHDSGYAHEPVVRTDAGRNGGDPQSTWELARLWVTLPDEGTDYKLKENIAWLVGFVCPIFSPPPSPLPLFLPVPPPPPSLPSPLKSRFF